jgi:glycosyltransferase involved in cell wall biosynthesis
MKILTVHNMYRYRGGEDEVREAEEQLLQSRGHEVRPLIFDNTGIRGVGAVVSGLSAPWSQASYNRTADEIASWRPDIVSVHNFFPLATPAVHYAAARAGVPVIQTLHNFRMLCPSAVLFRGGSPCEDCLGKVVPWPGIVHACYRQSYSASASAAAMISVHNLLKTWQKQVTLYFTLTEFSRHKFIQGGFPPERLVVKPNFVPTDLGPGRGESDFVFYAGRLTEEKGIPLLLKAWQVGKPRGRLLVAGDGPLAPSVRALAESTDSIQYLGQLSVAETYEYMGNARAFVFPSLWYEGMPRAIIEAFSRGTPVIANRLGSMAEMIRHEETGWLVESGNCNALADAISAAFSDRVDRSVMRSAARVEFERNYTADRQYDLLMDAYQVAIETKHT